MHNGIVMYKFTTFSIVDSLSSAFLYRPHVVIEDSMECKTLTFEILNEIKSFKKLATAMLAEKIKAPKLKFPVIDIGDIDVKEWYLSRNNGNNKRSGLVWLLKSFQLFLSDGEPAVLAELVTLATRLSRTLYPAFRDALKMANLTGALRPKAAPKPPTEEVEQGGSTAPKASRNRKRELPPMSGIQVLVKELSAEEDFKNYVLKLFKKDGFPQYWQIALVNSTTEFDPSQLETIKCNVHDFVSILKTKVDKLRENAWPEFKIHCIIDDLWNTEQIKMARNPEINSKPDVLFKSMADRVNAWRDTGKYLFTKAEKKRMKSTAEEAPSSGSGGSVPVWTDSVIVDDEIEVVTDTI